MNQIIKHRFSQWFQQSLVISILWCVSVRNLVALHRIKWLFWIFFLFIYLHLGFSISCCMWGSSPCCRCFSGESLSTYISCFNLIIHNIKHATYNVVWWNLKLAIFLLKLFCYYILHCWHYWLCLLCCRELKHKHLLMFTWPWKAT